MVGSSKFHPAIRHALTPWVSMRQRQEAMIMAAGTGDIAALHRFIEEYGCRVNWIIPGERRTALHAAVIFNQPGCVKALLNYGADTGIRDKHGKSSLDIATETAIDINTDPVYRLLVAKVTEIATLGGSVVDSMATSLVLTQDSIDGGAPGDLEEHASHTNLHDEHTPVHSPNNFSPTMATFRPPRVSTQELNELLWPATGKDKHAWRPLGGS